MKKLSVCVLFLSLKYYCVTSELCPEQKAECPSNAMCCPQKDGSYGCCPYKDGLCCSDKIHCCPAGTHCNTKHQSCDSLIPGVISKWMVPLYDSPAFDNQTVSEVARVPQRSDVKCQDGSSCPSSSTCCPMPGGIYGCCLYQDANCCSDKEHCCPSNYKCDVKNNRCVKQTLKTHSKLKSKYLPIYNIRTKKFEAMSSSYPCPETNFCKNLGLVCCIVDGAEYCCPPGLACSKKEMCSKKIDARFPAATNHLRKRFHNDELSNTLKDPVVVCPDKTEACPTKSTCCLMSATHYGCCPMPQATCCADMLHCCPHGYSCADGLCEKTQKSPFIQIQD